MCSYRWAVSGAGIQVHQGKKGSEPFTEKGPDPNGANLSRLSISIRHLRGRKLDRQAALGIVSARFRSQSVLQSRGFPTQDGHKLLIL
jgi:hypothetical protein